MPSLVASHLMIEKTFRRLISVAEEQVIEKSIEDWKLNQYVETLTNLLNDMRKAVNRPNSKQLEEYKQRIDQLRERIDPVKLNDQTFTRQQIPLQTKAETQSKEPSVHPMALPVQSTEKNPNSTGRSERPHLNRSQQHIQSEEEKQDQIAEAMLTTTRNLRQNAQNFSDIVKSDRKKIIETENLVDTNTAKLHLQSKRLKHHAYSGSNCWIYLMLLLVIIIFIYLTLFMRMFRKKISSSVINSSHGKKSGSLDSFLNETSLNESNVTTTTKSTDYISLLLNYANENHTDF